MTKFAVILFAALVVTFAGATALQAAIPGPPGPPSYIRCSAIPPDCGSPPPDCRRVPPGHVKCVAAKPPSYIRCLACGVTDPPTYPPPDCKRLPPGPVKCVTAKPSASSPTKVPPQSN
jgi:hypothetical protein